MALSVYHMDLDLDGCVLEIYCNQWGEKLWIRSVKLFKLASFSRSYAVSEDPFQ